MNQPQSHLGKSRLANLPDEIWKSAIRLRGQFSVHDYQNVVLPIITIQRLECVLIRWREVKTEKIGLKRPKITDEQLDDLVKKQELTLKGFSENIQDILDSLDYRAVIEKMVKGASMAPILNQYSKLDIGPETLSSLEMEYVYKEFLQQFFETHAEAAGDHFTPREVIRLMIELLQRPIATRRPTFRHAELGHVVCRQRTLARQSQDGPKTHKRQSFHHVARYRVDGRDLRDRSKRSVDP